MVGYDADGYRDYTSYHGVEHEWSFECDAHPKCRAIEKPGAKVDGDAIAGVGRFATKDSGERQEFDSGMRRDVETGKPRFDLIFPEGVPYADQFLTRFAELLTRGAEKYGTNNWQKANSQEELDRMRRSGLRHMIQWWCGEIDEDHAAAVVFNLMAAEEIKRKIQ